MMAAAALHSSPPFPLASCNSLPCKLSPVSFCGRRISFPSRPPPSTLLSFSSNLSAALPFSKGGAFLAAVEKPGPRRRSVVCEAAPTKKADSAAKRARQAEKRRVYNKAKKSEVKTRMRKVFEALDVLKKKAEAEADEILPIEMLIAEAYSAIDKAVKAGTLHRNTGAHRKSRLARRKRTVVIHHGWYRPASMLAA